MNHQSQIVATVLLGAFGAMSALFAPRLQEFNERMLPASLRNREWWGYNTTTVRVGGAIIFGVAVYLLVRELV